jgi:hypothetical protein
LRSITPVNGVWESWEIRLVRNQEIVGSNPTAPTETRSRFGFDLDGIPLAKTHARRAVRGHGK